MFPWYTLGCINCMTSMNPSHPVYWLDSHINITCRVSLTNVKLEECSWFVNSQRITTGQMFVNQNRKECSIAVVIYLTFVVL